MGFEKKSRPLARAYASAAQTIPHFTGTYINFDKEMYDTDGMFTPTDTKIYAKRFSGYYLIIGSCEWVANATGWRAVMLNKNAGDWLAGHDHVGEATIGMAVQVSSITYLAVDDYVRLYVSQGSGGNLNTVEGDWHTWLSIAHLSGR